MEARTLLYKLMVISPIAFVIWLAGVGRFQRDTFEFTGCTVRQHEVINLYRYPMMLADSIGLRPREAQEVDLRFVTSVWKREARLGSLRPVIPAEYGASVRDRVPSQIASGYRKVISFHVELAERAAKRGDFDQALADLRDAVELADVVKYSDAVAVTAFSLEQRTLMVHILAVAAHASEAARQETREFVVGIWRDRDGLHAIRRHDDSLKSAFRRSAEVPIDTSMEPNSVLASATRVADPTALPSMDLAERAENALGQKIREVEAQLR